MTFRVAIAVLLTLAGGLSLSAQRSGLESAPAVSLCELTEHAETYDGQIVKVRGTYRAAFEMAVFETKGCAARRVWIEFSPAVKSNTLPRILRRWEQSFRPPGTRRCDNVIYMPSYSVDVTFVARFEGIKPSTTILGRTLTYGFGHLNAYDYNLVVLRIDRVGRATEHGGIAAPSHGSFTIDCETVNRLPL